MRRIRLMVRHPDQRRHRTIRCGKIGSGATAPVVRTRWATAFVVRSQQPLEVQQSSDFSGRSIAVSLGGGGGGGDTVPVVFGARFLTLHNRTTAATFAKVTLYLDPSAGLPFQYVLDHTIGVRRR